MLPILLDITVSKDIKDGKKKVESIPERRPNK